MKWYKKQLDLLMKSQEGASETEKTTNKQKAQGQYWNTKRDFSQIKKFRNPVLESKLSRSKTDK